MTWQDRAREEGDRDRYPATGAEGLARLIAARDRERARRRTRDLARAAGLPVAVDELEDDDT